MKVLKSNKGFSLVELMIVVAIIGILASVAIPNFQRFQRKARQSEASSMLAGYHAAQKAAYAEWNFYPGSFSAVGFSPDGQLTYRITANSNITGNTAAPGPAPIPGYSATCTVTSVAAASCPAGFSMPWTEKPAGVSGGIAGPVNTDANCTAASGNNTFIACASAYLGATNQDTWRISEAKVLENRTNGL